VPDDEPTTQELKAVQAERADDESQRAADADQPDEARAHEAERAEAGDE
jgi:hypothetical protein